MKAQEIIDQCIIEEQEQADINITKILKKIK